MDGSFLFLLGMLTGAGLVGLGLGYWISKHKE